MQQLPALAALPDAASGALIQLVQARPARRLSYGLPIVLVTAIVGLALLVVPVMASQGLFQLLLLLVLVVAVAFGVGPALGAVTVGVAVTLAVITMGILPVAEPVLMGQAGLFAAEGTMIAFVGAVVRAAIRAALDTHSFNDSSLRDRPAEEPRASQTLIEPLTPREMEVLRAAASGRRVDDVAGELHVSANTVKTHLAHTYGKLGAHNRAEAVALALRCGCLAPADVERAAEQTAVDA